MNDTLKDLKAMRRRLAKRANWTQGAGARNRHGKPVRPESVSAVRWCLVGATFMTTTPWWRVIGILKHCSGSPCMSAWNDRKGRTHAEVLSLLDEAIAKARAA